MLKNTLLLASIMIFAGCATKPISAPIHHKPITAKIKPKTQIPQTQRVQPIRMDRHTEPVSASTIPEEMADTLNKSNSKSYVTTFKTQKFAFSDAGFMRTENGVIDLQILALGKPLLKLKISEDVCVDHHCRTRQEFNDNYLSPDYPYELINNVLMSQPIFGGENMKKTSNGFMQRIQSPLYNIKYKVAPGSIYFKDLQNNIIIKLRELP